ncbi:MAG: sorbitol-6-phosphate dehydrogenase [Elusimicrobiota bacterium]
MELKNKVAVVTGSAQGLGEALAYRLAEEGCDVVIADINTDKCGVVAENIVKKYERKSVAVKVDVTNENDVDAMVNTAVEKFGKLDILVSNAGILQAFDIAEFPYANWKKVVDVNLNGYFLCARAAARVMIPKKQGVIIQINSKSGKKGSFRNSAYAASKFGGIGLTQSVALDLAPYGIRVNAVCPGNLLDSPLWNDSLYEQYAKKWGITKEEVKKKYMDQVPLGRGCTYNDVANIVVFLASEKAAYMTGQAVNVTGGQEMR